MNIVIFAFNPLHIQESSSLWLEIYLSIMKGKIGHRFQFFEEYPIRFCKEQSDYEEKAEEDCRWTECKLSFHKAENHAVKYFTF